MNERLFSDEIRERERRRRRNGALWSVASFILHVALFAVIILMTPVKSLVFEDAKKAPKDAAKDLSADRIEEIAEALSEARINELMRQLDELQTVLHNMDLMKEELQKDYDAFAESSAEDVKDELSKLLDEAEQAQRDAVKHQEPMVEQVKAMLAEERADLTDEARAKRLRQAAEDLMLKTGEKVNDAQARAGNALDRVQVQAEFVGLAKTADASEKVRDAQIEASSLQNQAKKEAADVAYKMAEYQKQVRELASREKALAEQKDRLQTAEAERKDAAAQTADAVRKQGAAEKAREEANAGERSARDASRQIAADARNVKEQDKRNEAMAKSKEMTAKADEFKRAADAQNRQFAEERGRADREKRRMEHNARTAEDAQRRIKDLESKVAENKAEIRSIEQMRKEKVNDRQVEKLADAAKAQDKIRERIDVLRKVLASDAASPQKLAMENRMENDLVTTSVSSMNLADAYELARQIESAITESYKDIKSTQTAIERKMSFEAAQMLTDVAKAVRHEADRKALEDSPRTKEAVDAQKMAQTEVIREADTIVETAVAMMEEAMEIVKPDGGGDEKSKGKGANSVPWLQSKDFAGRAQEDARKQRLEQMGSAADYQLAITAAAAESDSQRAKDLTQIGASSGSGTPGLKTTSNGGPAGSASMAADYEGLSKGLSSGNGLAQLGDELPGLEGGNVIRFAPNGKSDGLPAKWMYVRDWHVIGPFPNPNRANLRRKFAPESVVDLDATYIGKGGKTVRWEFMQSRDLVRFQSWQRPSKAQVIPSTAEEYGIWYAYAEVFSDITCERWIAVGSDDRSDIWVNDVPVWGSSNQLKAWRIDEGFRRIRLNAGRNRILARIENGWHAFGWSVCISVEDGRLSDVR